MTRSEGVYHLVVVSTRADTTELLADAAWQAGAAGVEEFPGRVQVAFTDATIAARFATTHGGQVMTVADDAGLDGWREHARRWQAGPFSIRPPWLEASTGDPAADAIDLVIDPGRAFGAGSHPSSRLALALLSGEVGPGTTAVDVGCGSGLLSVAAARLGASVTAIDLDPAAGPATAANASANGVADRIDVHIGDAAELLADPGGSPVAGPVDLGLCNVTIDIHEHLAPALATVGTDRLIVAGILAGEQEERVARAHRRSPVRRVDDGDWVGLLLGPFDRGPQPSGP